MTDKYIPYKVNGDIYDIPESLSSDFEKDHPSATIEMHVGDDIYDVPLEHKNGFLNQYSNAVYAFDTPPTEMPKEIDEQKDVKQSYLDAINNPELTKKERRQITKEAREAGEIPTWGESLVKGAGSSAVGAASGLFDRFLQGVSGFQYSHPLTGQTYKAKDFYDEELRDPNSDVAKLSNKMRETAERLSKEADPTGGQAGFVDLIKSGNYGLALQKGLSTMAESSIQTVSAANPYLATLNFLSMWGRNYANETLENPDIPKWKRNAYAMGSAAFEQAVEKYADPVLKYIGGSKAVGEITEDLAKEIVEKATSEGVETLAKRILAVLKNTGKDMLGEGAEEVVTTVGTDAIGGTLDIISGEKDYGIRAQWEEYKKANPNATEEEFALYKSKEAMDSFIGGAFSAGYMSGSTQTASALARETAQFFVNKSGRNDMQMAYNAGETMSVSDMYDINGNVSEKSVKVSDSFIDSAGERILSDEFINSLTAEDAYNFSTRDGVTPEQSVALKELAQAKAIQEGLNNKLDRELQNNINTQNDRIASVSENGEVVFGMYNNQPVYVKGGIATDGAITLPNGENGPVIVVNALTGEEVSVRSEDIKYGNSSNAVEYSITIENQLKENDARNRETWSNTISASAKQNDIKQYSGKKVLINGENGIVEVSVEQILPNGDVLIKGKKGDLGGQSILTVNANDFYDSIYRDDTGNPVVTEVNKTGAEEVTKETTTEGPNDYREQTVTVLINGVPTSVEVTGQDNTANRITYEYTDENGVRRSGGSTITEFESSIQEEVEPSADTEAEVNPNVVAEQPMQDTTDEYEQTALASTPEEKVVLEPEEINWDALFEQDKDAYFAELQNQFGEETIDILNEEIETAQNEIDSLGKAKTKNQNERIANRKKKAALQERINVLNGMVAQLTPSNEVAEETVVSEPVVEEAVAEEPVVEQTEETVEPAAEQISEPVYVVPVAPNQVADPINEAKKIEAHLDTQLNRDLPTGQKQDLAKSIGKKVADMFATRDEYDAYQEDATDFGAYNEYFDKGVEESFANRQKNIGETPKTSIPLSSQKNEEENGTQRGVSSDERKEDVRKLALPKQGMGGVLPEDVANFSPISERVGESEEQRAERLDGFVSDVNRLTSDEQLYLYQFLKSHLNLSSSELLHSVEEATKSLRSNGNDFLATMLRDFIYDELIYRDKIAESLVNQYSYSLNTLSEIDALINIFHAHNEDEYNEVLFDRAFNLAKRFGVKLYFKTKLSDGRFIDYPGWYTVNNNTITLDASLLGKGREKTLCRVIVHELIHSVVSRAAAIDSGKALDEHGNIISPLSLPNDVKSGINTLKKVFDKIKNDPSFEYSYGNTDFEEMLSEISNSDFRDLLKVKKLWKKCVRGIGKLLGITKTVSSTDALTEIERALDKILSSAERGELDKLYSDFYDHTDARTLKYTNSSEIKNEKKSIKDKAISDGTFMKAPNGQPTKLTEEQWLTVRTQNFLNWFGDWINDPKNASKVVDENGEPMVVYHGSPYGNITEFNRKGHSVSGLREFGTYFGSNRRLAELYAYARQQAKGDVEKYELEKAKIDAIIFDPETPPRVALDAFDELDKLNESQKPKVYEVFLNIRNPKEFDAERSDGYRGWHKLKQDVGYDIKTGVEAVEALAGHNSAARMSEKYDGIIARNMADVHHEEGLDELMGDVFLVFDETPSHIKSATSNTGTFDIENPDIRYRKGENNDNFVEQFKFKQNNEQGELEYSDEFRGLQEESARMSGQLVSEKDGVQQAAISGLVGRIGGTLQKELDRARSGRGYKLRTVVNESKGTSFDIIENVDGRLFHDIFEVVRAYLPNGELVDLHDNYNDAICYITSDGLAGFAVDANGNLISVYSLYGASKRGFLGAIKDLITEAGATHLDGYNSKVQPLAKIYSDTFGWKVASMMDYNMEYDHDNIAENHGMPQVAFMVNTDADIETKYFDKDQYDEAVDYQQELVEISQHTSEQNEAIDNLRGEARIVAIESAVNEEAAKLGVKVTYKSREDMPKGHKNDKGYYNTKTGEIVICSENATDVADAIKTILHEAVAHKGLRKLMGDKFNEFINRVYNSLGAETKARVDALATANYNGDKAVAMEEYMATLAESENFAETSVWETIKSAFNNIINAILGRNDIKIGDKQLRYILRASYNNMVNPRGMESVVGWAQDQMMREEYGINETAETPEILSRTGIDDVAFTTAKDAYNTVTFSNFTEIFDMIRNAAGIKGKFEAAKTGWLKVWNEFQMEFQDRQQGMIAAIEAIQKENGGIPIEDFENYLFAENQMHGRSETEVKNYLANHFKPIIDQINSIITEIIESRGGNPKSEKRRRLIYAEVIQYLMAKHGLERNKLFQSTKMRKLTLSEQRPLLDDAERDYNDKVNQINSDSSLTDAERELQLRIAADEYSAAKTDIKTREVPDVRDYSGLTSLFGTKKLNDAEQMAQDFVDTFEAEVADEIDGLWSVINAATKKTLLHSYESGLIARSQYEKVRDMFKYYIPLRGFEETTAEDVFDYARFDGNKFQPAVRKAGGRTSVAFDPIAVIMNMAVSEITHGNGNRAKQFLYNFVANRPNSLMSIRDCWYVLDKNTGAYIEAYPDFANDESWEDFENRMLALAQKDEAVKRKKGLDIGYRFQKPSHKNEHYIHVMINGVEHAIFVNGNQRAVEAVNGFEDYTMDVIKALKQGNRFVSQFFTNYSYKFGGKNFFRDFSLATVSAFVKEDPKYMVRFAKNWILNNPVSIGLIINRYKKGKLDLSKENDRLFKEFIENGGQTGYVFIDSLEKQKAKIDNAIKKISKNGNTKTNAFTKATVLLDVIEFVNECFELSARFNTYATSRATKDKNGEMRSIMRSIDDAKNVTSNFNKKGAQSGRGVIGGLASVLGSTVFFFNAQMQGVPLIKSWFDKYPTKATISLLSFAGLGFALPYIISLFNGDDDDERYWNIPEYERKNNICIPFKNGVVMTIPLSQGGLRELYACGVTLSDAYSKKAINKDAISVAMECAGHLAKAFVPANPLEGVGVGLTPLESAAMFATPDLLDPVMEVIINKDYKGAPLEYQTTYNEGAPHYTKVVGKDNWKKSVGEKLYKAGEQNLDSSLDIPLYIIEHFITSSAGGIGNLVEDVANTIHSAATWTLPDNLNQIPLARILFSSNAKDDERFVNSTYWDMDKIYKQKIKVMSTVYGLTPKEAFEKEEGRGESNLAKVYDAKSFEWLKRYYELNKELEKAQKNINKMPTDTEAEENDKILAEQELFNKRREMVYELLEYEIE